MTWKGKRVLVTGAGGFIGSHLVERLVGLGAEVRALVRYNSAGSWGWLDKSPVRTEIEVALGDIRDCDSVAKVVQGAETVFHLAALIGIPHSYVSPGSYIRTNVEGTLNVLRAARDFGVDLVIHTSTSEAYGTARYVPIDEEHPLQGQSPYSASKIGADKLAESFHRSFGLPVATIRPFNTFGPRQSARAIIPTIITQALVGDQVRLGSLEPTRDFTYVADTVDGFIQIAECPEAVGTVVNVGSGHEISVGDLAKLILELLEKDVPIVHEDDRVRPEGSEVDRLCADNRRAGQLLGWKPTLTLREGLQRTIEWVQRHRDHYKIGHYAT